jgi:DNA mismatch repair protein MutL
VYGVPVLLTDHSPAAELEKLAQGMIEETEASLDSHERLALAMARSAGIKSGKFLSQEEMSMLIDELFACSIPSSTPMGKPIIHTIKLEELDRFFR